MLLTATQEQLARLIESLGACVAICEYTEPGDFNFIAANQRFNELIGAIAEDYPTHRQQTASPLDMSALIQRKFGICVVSGLKLSECVESRLPQSVELPFEQDGAAYCWRALVQPILHELGHVGRLMLTCFDVSEEVSGRKERATRRQRYRSVIESAHEGIVTASRDGDILVFNNAAQQIFGYAEQEALGQKLDMLLPATSRSVHAHHIEQFSRSDVQHREMVERTEVKGLHRDGTEFPVEISISKIEVDGAQEYTALVRDISKRAAMIDELRVRAATDPLTGLKNRRHLQERCLEIQALADRHAHPISVLMIDIDFFKRVNDTHGHVVGDHVLMALARTVERMLRKSDIPARIGGEEFVIVMPETTLDFGVLVAERLRTAFAEGQVDYLQTEKQIPFTVSIGVALYNHETDKTLEETIKRADDALYRAKEKGRNRVECADWVPQVLETGT